MVLALLSREPMHGYQLMGEVAERLAPHYRPSPGSLYPALRVMEEEGLIASTTGEDRRVYGVTREGTKALAERADRLAGLEARLGVRLAGGIDAVLARFVRRVRGPARRAGEEAVEEVLEAAAARIDALSEGGP